MFNGLVSHLGKSSFLEHPKMCELTDQNFTDTLPRSRFDVSYVRKPIIFTQSTFCATLHFIENSCLLRRNFALRQNTLYSPIYGLMWLIQLNVTLRQSKSRIYFLVCGGAVTWRL